MKDATFEDKVKYILNHCGNVNDCYYLIKALTNKFTLNCIRGKDFLDSRSAIEIRDLIFAP